MTLQPYSMSQIGRTCNLCGSASVSYMVWLDNIPKPITFAWLFEKGTAYPCDYFEYKIFDNCILVCGKDLTMVFQKALSNIAFFQISKSSVDLWD